jgi:hypothetical protein
VLASALGTNQLGDIVTRTRWVFAAFVAKFFPSGGELMTRGL